MKSSFQFSCEDVASLMGVSVHTVYHAIKTGSLNPKSLPSLMRFCFKDVLKAADSLVKLRSKLDEEESFSKGLLNEEAGFDEKSFSKGLLNEEERTSRREKFNREIKSDMDSREWEELGDEYRMVVDRSFEGD